MRFVTSAKYLIGIAVASSAVLVLTGSAFAADAGAVSAVDQQFEKTAPATSETPAPATSAEKTSSSDADQPKTQDSVESTGNTTTTVTQSSQTSSTTSTNSVSGVGSEGNGSGGVSASTAPDKHPAVAAASGTTQPLNSTQTPSAGNDATKAANTVNAASVAASTTDEASKTQLAAASDQPVVRSAAPQAAVPTVVLGDHRLPIQPVITSRSTVPADLAAAVPSAPVRGSLPVPTQSTGLLSALTVGLATTVAQHVSLPDASALAVELPSIALALAFIGLLPMLLLTFGAWLRRAGYVAAPRSDVANHQVSFATPLLMGYVSAAPKSHNPFLVVSDTKTLSVMFVTS